MRCSGASVPTLPMPELRLFHSDRKCAKFLRSHGIEFDKLDTSDAQSWMFDDGHSHAVVLFSAGTGHDYCEDIGLLVHEATHVALYALRSIGEDEPAEEEMCYVVQTIAQSLCAAHFDWKERKLKGNSHG